MQYVSVAFDITNHYQLLPLLFPCSITFCYRRNRIVPPFVSIYKFHVSSVINNSASSASRVNINYFFPCISLYTDIHFCKFFFSLSARKGEDYSVRKLFSHGKIFRKISKRKKIWRYSFIRRMSRPERIKKKRKTNAIEEHPSGGKKKNTEEVEQASFEVSFYYFDLTGGAVMRNENTVTLNR